ncbi:PqqD family peptide modification chaperone [Nocardia thraciensis]
MLILYAGDLHFSGWSMRGRIAVREKDIPFDERRIELDWPTTETPEGVLTVDDVPEEREAHIGCQARFADLAARDPENALAGSVVRMLPRVPVLVDTETGAVASDVVAMAEYLDEIVPESGSRLMGSTPAHRAVVRSVCAWASHDLSRLIDDAPYAISLRPQPPSHLDPAAVEQARWVCDVVAGLLDTYGGPYAISEFSLVDVMLSTNFQQITGLGMPITDPRVAEYAERLLQRASVRDHLDQARAVYRAIDEAESGSPQWILRHYRYNPAQKLLHDWQTDTCVRLRNPTAERIVDLAYTGHTIDQIAQTIAREYGASPERVTVDVLGLLDRLAPRHEKRAA